MMRENRTHKMNATQWANVLILAVIFVGAIIYSLQGGNESQIEFQFEEASMTMTGPEGAPPAVEIPYENITSMSELSSLDAGTHLTGICTDTCWFGTWRSDVYGVYTLCADPSCSAYIVLETTEGTVVFNYGSADMTKSLYEALLELLETKSNP